MPNGTTTLGPGVFSVPIQSEQAIDPPHDPFRPLYARVNQLVRSWASLRPTKQIIGGLHVQTGENRRHYAQYPLAALAH